MLVLPGSVRDDLLQHAREGAPEEVCGVLVGWRADDGGGDGAGRAGDDGADDVHVESVRRVPNVADDPRTEYCLDPEAHLAVHEDLADADRAVVGFYHSHPDGPARPSATDAARASWPGYVYAVVSLAGGDADDGGPAVGAWTWTGEGFAAESVRVVG